MRLLVVEDDIRMASMVRRGLVEDGYAVDVISDGTEAVWQATETEYDAIVLDLMLPGIDGFEVCRRLREAGRWSPVLMLTARTAVHDRVRGLDSGADDYLAKPFSFDELSARIRALVRRGAPVRPTVLSAGSLRLDPATHSAWRGEELLDLSAKEFALLSLFLRRPDEVLSRTEILDHVWDFAYERGKQRRRSVRGVPAPKDRPTVRPANSWRRSAARATGCAPNRGSRTNPPGPTTTPSPPSDNAVVTIRLRLACLFTAVTLALLAGGGILFVTQLESGLEATLDTSLAARAASISAQAASLPPDAGVTDSRRGTPLTSANGITAELIAPDGTIVRASRALGPSPFDPAHPGRRQRVGTP